MRNASGAGFAARSHFSLFRGLKPPASIHRPFGPERLLAFARTSAGVPLGQENKAPVSVVLTGAWMINIRTRSLRGRYSAGSGLGNASDSDSSSMGNGAGAVTSFAQARKMHPTVK